MFSATARKPNNLVIHLKNTAKHLGYRSSIAKSLGFKSSKSMNSL
jgi:hypothetical protein